MTVRARSVLQIVENGVGIDLPVCGVHWPSLNVSGRGGSIGCILPSRVVSASVSASIGNIIQGTDSRWSPLLSVHCQSPCCLLKLQTPLKCREEDADPPDCSKMPFVCAKLRDAKANKTGSSLLIGNWYARSVFVE